MNHPTETRIIPATHAQGTLFSRAALPRQLRTYKSEMEEDFLPPRDQRLWARVPH